MTNETLLNDFEDDFDESSFLDNQEKFESRLNKIAIKEIKEGLKRDSMVEENKNLIMKILKNELFSSEDRKEKIVSLITYVENKYLGVLHQIITELLVHPGSYDLSDDNVMLLKEIIQVPKETLQIISLIKKIKPTISIKNDSQALWLMSLVSTLLTQLNLSEEDFSKNFQSILAVLINQEWVENLMIDAMLGDGFKESMTSREFIRHMMEHESGLSIFNKDQYHSDKVEQFYIMIGSLYDELPNVKMSLSDGKITTTLNEISKITSSKPKIDAFNYLYVFLQYRLKVVSRRYKHKPAWFSQYVDLQIVDYIRKDPNALPGKDMWTQYIYAKARDSTSAEKFYHALLLSEEKLVLHKDMILLLISSLKDEGWSIENISDSLIQNGASILSVAVGWEELRTKFPKEEHDDINNHARYIRSRYAHEKNKNIDNYGSFKDLTIEQKNILSKKISYSKDYINLKLDDGEIRLKYTDTTVSSWDIPDSTKKNKKIISVDERHYQRCSEYISKRHGLTIPSFKCFEEIYGIAKTVGIQFESILGLEKTYKYLLYNQTEENKKETISFINDIEKGILFKDFFAFKNNRESITFRLEV